MQCDSARSPLPKIGPHSRPHKLAVVDGRRAEAKMMKRVREELTAYVGGSPSVTQRLLIERASRLSLRLALMDKASLTKAGLSERNAREYIALDNCLRRTLLALGAPAPERPPSLAEIMARPIETAA